MEICLQMKLPTYTGKHGVSSVEGGGCEDYINSVYIRSGATNKIQNTKIDLGWWPNVSHDHPRYKAMTMVLMEHNMHNISPIGHQCI